MVAGFRPDQVSPTARTFTSASPTGGASSRTPSSVMPVGTFDDFFGQDTQITASRLSFASASWSAYASCDFRALKT